MCVYVCVCVVHTVTLNNFSVNESMRLDKFSIKQLYKANLLFRGHLHTHTHTTVIDFKNNHFTHI